MKLRRRKHLPIKKWFGIITNYLLGKIGGNKSWLKELVEYYKWESENEFYPIYKKKQAEANTLWNTKPRKTEKDIRSFYGETDYWILRQMFHHKNNCFPEIAQILPQNKPIWFCEYGAGVAPVTAWLLPRFDNIHFTLVDLDVPALNFAKWRFAKYKNVEFLTVPLNGLPLTRKYDFITCFEVLEHVTNAFEVVQHLVKNLKTGGTLFLDFIQDEDGDENLPQSQAQRIKSIDFLNNNLEAVWALDKTWTKDGGFGQYVKLKEF